MTISGGAFEPSDFGVEPLFEDPREAVVVGNAATERIVLWNDAAERLFGYTEAEALQLYLHTLVPAELVPVHRAGLARYQATGKGNLVESGTPVALVGRHKDGRTIAIELTLTPIEELAQNGDRFALATIHEIASEAPPLPEDRAIAAAPAAEA